MGKNFSDWFNAYDLSHQKAYLTYLLTEKLPDGFVPKEVGMDSDWEQKVDKKVEDCFKNPPPDLAKFRDEFHRVRKIVRDVHVPGMTLDLGLLGDYFYVRTNYLEADVVTGQDEVQLGRLWVFPAGQTQDQIVNTCFKAVFTSVEHQLREHFSYRGVPVMYPHRDLDEVVEMMSRKVH